MKKEQKTKLDFLTINLTREGLDAISGLIKRSPYLNQILDGKSHFTENCEWIFDVKNNRNAYRLHLPKNKLEVLNFLFTSELEKRTTESFWEGHYVMCYRRHRTCKKMLKRILKAIKKLEVK